MEKEINYNDYNFLTDVQREIYLKVKDGAKFSHIARDKGVNPEAVRTAYRRAERRVKEYERFHAVKERNLEVIDMQITRGELKAMKEAVYSLRLDYQNKVGRPLVSDWAETYPYMYDVVCGLYDKIEQTLEENK